MLASLFGLDELRDRHVAALTHTAPVDLDSRDFMKSFRCEVAGSAMRAAKDGYSLNLEQGRASSIATGYRSNLNTGTATVFATCLLPVIPHIQ